MPSQKDTLLQHIGAMEGKTITSALARQCRDLAGTAVDTEANRTIQMLAQQAMILMVRNLGKEVTYSVDQIDDEPRSYNLVLEQVVVGPRKVPGFKFKLVTKK